MGYLEVFEWTDVGRLRVAMTHIKGWLDLFSRV